MDIRENMLATAQPGKQKELYEKFWNEFDKLCVDVETIPTYKEFRRRFSEMYSFLIEGDQVTGEIHLLTLWGLEEKANSLFSEEERKNYRYFED